MRINFISQTAVRQNFRAQFSNEVESRIAEMLNNNQSLKDGTEYEQSLWNALKENVKTLQTLAPDKTLDMREIMVHAVKDTFLPIPKPGYEFILKDRNGTFIPLYTTTKKVQSGVLQQVDIHELKEAMRKKKLYSTKVTDYLA